MRNRSVCKLNTPIEIWRNCDFLKVRHRQIVEVNFFKNYTEEVKRLEVSDWCLNQAHQWTTLTGLCILFPWPPMVTADQLFKQANEIFPVKTKETCQIVVIIRIGGCVAPWGEQVLSVRVDGQVSFHLRSDGQHRVAKNTRLRFRVGLPAVIRLRAAVITRTALCRRKMSFIQTDNVTPWLLVLESSSTLYAMTGLLKLK